MRVEYRHARECTACLLEDPVLIVDPDRAEFTKQSKPLGAAIGSVQMGPRAWRRCRPRTRRGPIALYSHMMPATHAVHEMIARDPCDHLLC